MKTQDKIILALICFSMLTVMVNSSAQEKTIGKAIVSLDSGSIGETLGIGELIAETIEEPSLGEDIVIGEAVEQTTVNVQNGQPFVTEEYMTSNGLMLTLGRIYNYAGSEKNELVSISMNDKLIDFNISIDSYSVWNFAKIDGVLIVPMTSAVIDPYSTSFYPSGEELVIKMNSTALHELEIYTGSKGAPSIIIPKVPISWTYDNDKKIVTITSKMGSIADNSGGGSYLYRSSKAAVNMVVKSLAIDLKPLGITAVVVHPGWVKSDMGGPNAMIPAEHSVAGMRQVIDSLTLESSGTFFAYDGQVIPW